MHDFQIIPILSIILLLLLCVIVYQAIEKRNIRNKIQSLAENALEITPQEFFALRNKSFSGRGNPHYSNKYNFTGIYILFNTSKNMYYVGQGAKVFDRVNCHFTGKGNGDVYADYKYGDCFKIRMICLENSGFSTLNDLERNTIQVYNSCAKGYNKSKGNH